MNTQELNRLKKYNLVINEDDTFYMCSEFSSGYTTYTSGIWKSTDKCTSWIDNSYDMEIPISTELERYIKENLHIFKEICK